MVIYIQNITVVIQRPALKDIVVGLRLTINDSNLDILRGKCYYYIFIFIRDLSNKLFREKATRIFLPHLVR